MAIDPWKAGSEGFADLRTRTISHLVAAEQTREAWEGRGSYAPEVQLRSTALVSNLLLKRAEVLFRDQKTGASPQVVFDVNLTPTVLHRDIGGAYEEDTGLQHGRFRLELALVEVGLDISERTLIGKNDGVEGDVQNGQLVMPSVPLRLVAVPQADFTRSERNRFRWELYFKLTPVGEGLDGLMPAEGVLSYQPGQSSGPITPLKLGTVQTLVDKSSLKENSRSHLKPRLVLEDYSFEFKSRSFEVDKYLELSQVRDYEMTFTPQLYYPFDFRSGAEKHEPLRTGEHFRFGFVFLAGMPDTTDKQGGRRFLSRFDSDVVVGEDARIHVDVPMRVRFSEEPYLDSSRQSSSSSRRTTWMITCLPPAITSSSPEPRRKTDSFSTREINLSTADPRARSSGNGISEGELRGSFASRGAQEARFALVERAGGSLSYRR